MRKRRRISLPARKARRESKMTRTTKTAYLALGSNQGDREKHIERALAALTAAGIAVRRRSPLYETQPVGTAAQRWFLNCVLEVETELMPLGKRGRQECLPHWIRKGDFSLL